MFSVVKSSKAGGPDKVSGKSLKVCSKQLAPVFHNLFKWSLNCSTVPEIWKTVVIFPVPKVSKPCELNDYRPVALTSIAMKCLERLSSRPRRPKTQKTSSKSCKRVEYTESNRCVSAAAL